MDIMKDGYYALLDSPLWKEFRLGFIRRNGSVCVRCGGHRRPLQVHHKRYYAGRKPWDYSDDDLECLCIDCHRKTHLELIDRGRKIPVYDSDENQMTIPDDQCCRYCGGSGFKEDFPYLLGGLCFHCFGTGIRFVHRYSPSEAIQYGRRIYNQWLAHHESSSGEVDSERFSCPDDVTRWLLSMNDTQ